MQGFIQTRMMTALANASLMHATLKSWTQPVCCHRLATTVSSFEEIMITKTQELLNCRLGSPPGLSRNLQLPTGLRSNDNRQSFQAGKVPHKFPIKSLILFCCYIMFCSVPWSPAASPGPSSVLWQIRFHEVAKDLIAKHGSTGFVSGDVGWQEISFQ